jgi:hypothetical protein
MRSNVRDSLEPFDFDMESEVHTISHLDLMKTEAVCDDRLELANRLHVI